MNIEKLKYPIGKPKIQKKNGDLDIKKWIKIIKNFPLHITKEIEYFSQNDLQCKYRPNGWTIQQIVCHCLDSHINSFIRFKLALTEDNPIIKPYAENKWAELPDTLDFNINEVLILLTGIHKRWVFLLEQLDEIQLNRTFIHPDGNETISLKENLAIYAWHCEHHLQHIVNAKKFKY